MAGQLAPPVELVLVPTQRGSNKLSSCADSTHICVETQRTLTSRTKYSPQMVGATLTGAAQDAPPLLLRIV